MKDISNHVAIITGSSSGVGAATAKLFASLGCHVVINYNSNSTGADEVAAACEAFGVETLVMKANVAQDENCLELVAGAMAKWGRVNILVNNAGTTKFNDHAKLHGLSAEDFHHIYGVNVVGTYQMTRAVHDAMNDSGETVDVVNIASIAGVTGIGSSIAYAASKGAMVTMTLSLARALGPAMRVNAICPGFIEGEWLREGIGDEKYEQARNYNSQNSAMRANATPELVADSILQFVVGSQVITGETLIVDGGRHLSTAPLSRR
ncbi:MAG: oxidoreductase [Pseudohongiella sp.]|nr:MAG: oxidoreductase [Pseudohongiella sp.]